jgi:GGDEF domain-containing protein
MEAMKELGNNDDFLGHIGGDDFILITTPDKVDLLSNRIIETFDRIIPFYYDKKAREKGYIEGIDRQGIRNRFPIMSISIAVVTNTHREIRHIGEVSDIAAELKKLAKMTHGSIVVKDQRKKPIKVA